MAKQQNFEIAVSDWQEAYAARETLRAIGYDIFGEFSNAHGMEGYTHVVHDGAMICRGGRGVLRKRFNDLQDFLNEEFKVKSPAQLELEKLEEQSRVIQARIITLKATI